MGRSPCCSKEGLNRGAWTALEDRILTSYIKTHGEGKWRNLPKKAGLKRCGKSCRLRWLNYLRPDIKRGNISHDEEELIIRLHNLLGNRWSLIAGRIPGRTDNEIKNYWNTTLGKRAKAQAAAASTQTSPTNSPQPKPKPKPKAAATATHEETQIQVIRTKASRCSTKIVVPSQPPPTQADTDHIDHDIINNLILHHRPFQQLQDNPAHCGTEVVDSLYGSDDQDILNLGIDVNNQMQAINHVDVEINNDIMISKDLSLDPVQSLPFDEAMFQDWISNANANANCLDDDGNAAMDLDSLAFLLDDPEDQWP